MAKTKAKLSVKSKAKSSVKPKAKGSQATKKVAKKALKKVKKAPVKAAKPKKSLAVSAARVVVGNQIPAFAMPSTGGKTVLSDMLKGKAVVLYFYPRDATPGCTVEGQDFTRLHGAFKKLGAEVFGVSRDSIKSHEKFKATQCYSLDLLSDEDETFCQMFGVMKMKNMYGKQVRGIERSTFVIDKTGKLVKEWRGVKVPGHAEEVLEFIKTL